jgi:predicted Zn-dependent peptidase
MSSQDHSRSQIVLALAGRLLKGTHVLKKSVAGLVVLALIGFAAWRVVTDTSDVLVALDHGPFRGAYLVRDVAAETIELTLVVQSGEADATGAEGIAHYVEHLSWLNANKNSAEQARHSNAATTSVATTYWVMTMPEALDATLANFIKISSPLTVSPDFMNQERDIVLREYDLRARDDPFAPVNDAMLRSLYGDMPLARSVIGTPQSIASFTLQQAQSLRNTSHRLDNMVLVIKGNITAARAQAAIAGLRRPDARLTRPAAYPVAPDAVLDDRMDVTLAANIPVVVYDYRLRSYDGCQTPAACGAALNLLYNVLVSALPGGLAKPLRFDAFLAQGFDLTLAQIDQTHILIAFMGRPDVGVSPQTLAAAYQTGLQDIARTGVPRDTFDTVKERLLEDFSNIDDIPAEVQQITLDMLALRSTPYDLDAAVAALKAFDRNDLNAMIQDIAGPGRTVVRLITPSP